MQRFHNRRFYAAAQKFIQWRSDRQDQKELARHDAYRRKFCDALSPTWDNEFTNPYRKPGDERSQSRRAASNFAKACAQQSPSIAEENVVYFDPRLAKTRRRIVFNGNFSGVTSLNHYRLSKANVAGAQE